MKPYTDIFKKPIKRDEVATATRLVVSSGRVSTSLIQRRMQIGYGKAARIVELLEDAKVVDLMHNGHRTIILKNEEAAVNAALRQFKKGKLKKG